MLRRLKGAVFNATKGRLEGSASSHEAQMRAWLESRNITPARDLSEMKDQIVAAALSEHARSPA